MHLSGHIHPLSLQTLCPDFYCPSEPLPRPTEARTKIPLWGLRSDCPNPDKEGRNSLPPPPLVMVLSNSKRKNTAVQALVLQPGAGNTTFWPIPGQPLRVLCQVIPPNKCPVSPERIMELSGPPPDECRAPETEWGQSEESWASYIQWLRVPGSQKMLNMCGMYKCMNPICRPPTACTPSPKLGMTRA